MKPMQTIEQKWSTLFTQIPNLEKLKAAATAKDSRCTEIADLRSVCWKIFLLFNTYEQSSWSDILQSSRHAYNSLREHFLKSTIYNSELESEVDPLNEDDDSPWKTLQEDELARAEIFQDVERCMPDNTFFREPTSQRIMLDVLFIYCKINPDIGYRQGMHELLAPLLWVISNDAIKVKPSDEAKTPSILEQTLDSTFIEHDVFTLFSIVMQSAISFYQPAQGGQGSSAPIIERSNRIHKELLVALDPEVAEKLTEVEVLPQVFLIRWVRLLFGREFPFEDLLSLWDGIFAVDPTLKLVDLICVAMILRVRWQLLESDYSSALTVLLRYPVPVAPNRAPTFLQDAVFLQDHLNVNGGYQLIEKYSGRRPEPYRPASTVREKIRGVKFDESIRKLNLIQPSQKRFDEMLQEAAKGILDRGEKWGVNKAVRDAVGEVRRNIQGIQQTSTAATAAYAAARNREGESSLSHTLSPSSSDTQAIQTLRVRELALAALLGKAISKAQLPGSADADAGKALSQLIAALSKIKACLEDEQVPIPGNTRVAVTKTDAPRNTSNIGESSPPKVGSSTSVPKPKDQDQVVKSSPASTSTISTETASAMQRQATSATPKAPAASQKAAANAQNLKPKEAQDPAKVSLPSDTDSNKPDQSTTPSAVQQIPANATSPDAIKSEPSTKAESSPKQSKDDTQSGPELVLPTSSAEEPSSSPAQAPAPKRVISHKPRPSLTDSSFSWMLGDEPSKSILPVSSSSFSSPSSPPRPEATTSTSGSTDDKDNPVTPSKKPGDTKERVVAAKTSSSNLFGNLSPHRKGFGRTAGKGFLYGEEDDDNDGDNGGESGSNSLFGKDTERKSLF